MRIKSNYKDYYDGLSAYDEDRETLYLRRTEIIDFKEYHLGAYSYSPGFCPIGAKFQLIGFCGKIYPRIEVSFKYRNEAKLFYCWSTEEVERVVDKYFNTDNAAVFRAPWTRQNRSIWCNCHRRVSFNQFFNPAEYHFQGVSGGWESYHNFMELFEKAPVWIYSGDKTVTVNPRLASLNFQKMVPPPQAYQSLRVWICNQAHPNKPIPNISNKDMIIAKGFDLKKSFRKEKEI